MTRAALLAAALLALGGCKKDRPEGAPAAVTGGAAAEDAAGLYAAGKSALAHKRPSDAVTAFTQATTRARDPDLRANAWLGLGAAYEDLGDHAHAVAAYEQVTVLRPDDPDGWRVLAEGLGAAGERARQAQALDHVIALDPDDLAAYLDLAGLDVALGKADASKDVYLRYETRRRDALVALGRASIPTERVHAAETLGGARDAGTAKALVLAMTDKDPTVRLACARSLGRIGVDVDPQIRPALATLRGREQEPDVRRAIDEALAGAAR